MSDIGVMSMQRNESKYILEWFAYYLVQGVNKFVIYNHMSEDNTEDLYRRLALHYDIDIHNMTGHNVHYPMLAHAVANYRDRLDWLIFADMDEFYMPLEKDSIAEVLADYEHMPSSALGVYWTFFGNNGHLEDPEFVLPSYTKRAPIGHILNHHMKPIVRGRGRDEVHTTNPHVFTTSHGTQDMEGRLIPPHAGHNIHGESCHTVMRINHYWAKSWEYFKTKKQVRGSTADRPPGAPGADIPDDFWHQQNFNDEDDTIMVDRFWPRVQEQIKQLKEKIQ
jgi:hypothetical protein